MFRFQVVWKGCTGGTCACEPMGSPAGLGEAPGSSPSASALQQPSTYDWQSFLGAKNVQIWLQVCACSRYFKMFKADVTAWEPATFTAAVRSIGIL